VEVEEQLQEAQEQLDMQEATEGQVVVTQVLEVAGLPGLEERVALAVTLLIIMGEKLAVQVFRVLVVQVQMEELEVIIIPMVLLEWTGYNFLDHGFSRV
jgi:hypothetical protein